VNKNQARFTTTEHATRFIDFINSLLRCTYPHLIDYAKELLERELRRVGEEGFLAYWKQEWSHRVCMPGALPWGMPITNNAIERWFRLLKASLGKATKTWLHVFKLLIKLAKQDSRKETEFKLTPDMTGPFGKECWTEAQRLWASGFGPLCEEVEMHGGKPAILMPCEAAVSRLPGTGDRRLRAYEAVKQEWLTGFYDVHEDPIAAERNWLGHRSEVIDDFWNWANWFQIIMRLEDCDDVSDEQRRALNKLHIFHRCFCYKNSRYK
jgi:hypothetical protein